MAPLTWNSVIISSTCGSTTSVCVSPGGLVDVGALGRDPVVLQIAPVAFQHEAVDGLRVAVAGQDAGLPDAEQVHPIAARRVESRSGRNQTFSSTGTQIALVGRDGVRHDELGRRVLRLRHGDRGPLVAFRRRRDDWFARASLSSRRSGSASHRQIAAIDRQDGAGDERAAGEARNTIAAGDFVRRSPASHRRAGRIGRLRSASLWQGLRSAGVAIQPGATALTRMPSGAQAAARLFVSCADAALRGGIARHARTAEEGQHRGHVDDGPLRFGELRPARRSRRASYRSG